LTEVHVLLNDVESCTQLSRVSRILCDQRFEGQLSCLQNPDLTRLADDKPHFVGAGNI